MQQQLESRLRRLNYRFQKHFIANQMYVIAFGIILILTILALIYFSIRLRRKTFVVSNTQEKTKNAVWMFAKMATCSATILICFIQWLKMVKTST